MNMFTLMKKNNKALVIEDEESKREKGYGLKSRKRASERMRTGEVKDRKRENYANVLAYAKAYKIMKDDKTLNRKKATEKACERTKGSVFNTVYQFHKGLKVRAEKDGLI